MVAPDGRPLTEAEIASGQFGIGGLPPVPLPPPLSVAAPPNPPEGVPRAASRILLLLQSMGAKQFDPKVVTQLLDVMQTWTCTVLLDASQNARMRLLSRQTYQQQQQQQAAPSGEPMVEVADVELATRLRMESGQFTRTAPREVLAQQAADANAEPMPILPRRSVVVPPTDAAQVAPAARRLLAAGLEIDDDDELEEHYRDQPALTPSGAVVRGGGAAGTARSFRRGTSTIAGGTTGCSARVCHASWPTRSPRERVAAPRAATSGRRLRIDSVASGRAGCLACRRCRWLGANT